ncbi:hypothetical protein ASF21_02925 [Arthrobacter sp. Leaf234]|uniref:hypothetical protein n=1 Tax=Arthrobacter sp. Leaf234 TaxID=1736303 RepID=UPI0006F4213A|nr:hypothetical protein [Arthrobacter sp. Leaf234]KQO03281.1 hypothetical protein ASF21_02925 [Arthrobacter sp. Leaf234]
MATGKRIAATAGAAALAATALLGSAPAAQAGVGGCSSLAADGQFIVGSCTADNPGPGATITVVYSCFGLRPGSQLEREITVGYGASFKEKTGCITWVTDVHRVHR